MCYKSFNSIASSALSFSWTRDPFDRIIVADAFINQNILKNYEKAIW
jgi:PIN domain nuclease of toxin-antitoxin system